MDFHRLTRRELQALCKKNKIPANITNVAMADSLKALEIVEGIEEFLQKCESETAQSSIESPARSEVTSPYVPPTGGRSTRRRNVAREEPETAKPSTRTQRTTRRTVAKYADEPQVEAIETPAVVPQTNRKKGPIASARRNMDSQFQECVEEEKKDVVVTPAPSGATSRRRRGAKDESAVKRVYGTRRSVRLAQKNVELLNEIGNEDLEFSKKDLFNDDSQELKTNLKERSDDMDELSGITDVVDAHTTLEENSEKKGEAEVVSAEKQDMSTVNKVELLPTIEDEMSHHSEADGAKLELKESNNVEENSKKKDEAEVVSAEIQDMSTINEVELVPAIEDEMSDHAEADDAKLELQESSNVEETSEKKDETEVVSTEIQDISTINEVELVPTIEDEISNHSEADGAKPELKESSDVEIEELGFGSEIEAKLEKEKCDETEAPNDENKAQEIDGSHDSHTSEIEVKVEKIEQNTDKDAEYEDQTASFGENAVLESEEQKTDKDAGYEDQAANFGENTVLKDNFVVCEVSCDTDIHNEIEKEIYNDKDLDSKCVTDFNVDEEVLEIDADVHGDSGEKELTPDELDSVISEAAEESTDVRYQNMDDLSADMPFDISLTDEEDEASNLDSVLAYLSGKREAIEAKDESNLVKDTNVKLPQSAEEVFPGKELDDVVVEELGEIEIVQTEENKKAGDRVPPEASDSLIDAPPCGEAVNEQLPIIKISPSKQLEGIGVGDMHADADHIPAFSVDDELDLQIPPSLAGLDSHLIQPTCLTPIKASAKNKKIAAVSDNKENIGSGSKLVLAKERVKIARNTAADVPNLHDLSMRQLTKMLKETLQISNKSSKNENDSEVSARPALQALPENR